MACMADPAKTWRALDDLSQGHRQKKVNTSMRCVTVLVTVQTLC